MPSFDSSFSAKLKAGWSKADIMRYYCLKEEQYSKVIESLERIWAQQVREREIGNRDEDSRGYPPKSTEKKNEHVPPVRYTGRAPIISFI